MVLVEKWPSIQLSFLGNKGRVKVFQDILQKETAFLDYKKEMFKTSKNGHFSKGVNPWFWSKNGHFSNLFFQAIQVSKISFTIFYKEKTLFKAIKKVSSKSQEIDIFPKGLTHGFGSKLAIFPTFFFRQYRPGKYLLRYSSTKERLSRL